MATIRDVARECGVSTATVSIVLNGQTDRISPETCAKVMAAVRKLRYRLPAVEDRQKAVRTQTIALICGTGPTPLSENKYFSGVLDGILEITASRGWATTISFEEVWDHTGCAVRRSYDGRCDGALLLAPFPDAELIDLLHNRGTPFVMIGTTHPSKEISTVDSNNVEAAMRATKYLWDLGHRRITFLGGDERTRSVTERSEGYRHQMIELGAREDDIQIHYSGFDSNSAYARTMQAANEFFDGEGEDWATGVVRRAYLDAANKPTALLCWNDNLAKSAATELQHHGISVPEDVSMVAFDGVGMHLPNGSGIDSMRQSLRKIGAAATTHLLQRIHHHEHPAEQIFFSCDLVPSGSCLPLEAL